MKSRLWWLILASVISLANCSSEHVYKTEDNLSDLLSNSYNRNEERAPTVDDDEKEDEEEGDVYKFLYKRMQEDAKAKQKSPPKPYMIPGPQEPLPGRTHDGDYWPVFPFQNQFSAGLDLDPSDARHIGGDLNLAVPSWGMLDIYGRFWNRVPDTTTKIGYINHPVNMMDLEKEDLVQLMSNPSNHWNRAAQPTLPLGKLARQYVPLSCKPPLCNPYHHSFGLGIEHDWGTRDGVEGDIDVPIPLSKGVAYRFPFSGKIYYDFDNMTVTYGQNLSPIDPFSSLFDYQKTRAPEIAMVRNIDHHEKLPFSRVKRHLEVINNKSNSKPVYEKSTYDPKNNIDAIVKPLEYLPHEINIVDFPSDQRPKNLRKSKKLFSRSADGSPIYTSIYYTNLRYEPLLNSMYPSASQSMRNVPYLPQTRSYYVADDDYTLQQMQRQFYEQLWNQRMLQCQMKRRQRLRRAAIIQQQRIKEAITVANWENFLMRSQYDFNTNSPMAFPPVYFF